MVHCPGGNWNPGKGSVHSGIWDHEKKLEKLRIFPMKKRYLIPKSLKVGRWLSEGITPRY